MSKLTSQDLATVEAYFTSPLRFSAGDGLAAQSYEPRGTGYDPTTDMRLARLVVGTVPTSTSRWAKASRVVDQLVGVPGGSGHLEVLHRYGTSRDRAAIGAHTPRALARGRELARDAECARLLEREYSACRDSGLSSYDTTARVLAFDAQLYRRHIEVNPLVVPSYAYDAVRDALVDVDAEIDALLDVAADALHAAQAKVEAASVARTAARVTRRSTLRATLAGKESDAARVARLLTACVELSR